MPKKLISTLDHFCPHPVDWVDIHLSGAKQDLPGLLTGINSGLLYRAIWLESNLTWYLLDNSTWNTVLKLYDPNIYGIELIDLCNTLMPLVEQDHKPTIKTSSAINNYIYKGEQLMRNITHVMIDIECGGLHLDAPIWNIGACGWDQRSNSFKLLNKVDVYVPVSMLSGPFSHEAIEFAEKTEVFTRIRSETAEGMRYELRKLFNLLSIEGVKIYCKGASFDYPRIILFLEHLFRQYDMKVAEDLLEVFDKKYKDLLCMRQNINMFPMMPKGYPISGAHGGLADSLAQAEATYFHLRALEKLVYPVEEDTLKPIYCLPAKT